MRRFLHLLLPLLFVSCNSYYYVILEEDTPLYASQNDSETKIVVPANSYVFIDGKSKSYRKIKYNNHKGWAYTPKFNLTTTRSSTKTNYSQNSSNYNSSSTSKEVHVKGYYRKNGSYVKPHTRSAPRRKG